MHKRFPLHMVASSVGVLLLAACSAFAQPTALAKDARLKSAYSFQKVGWTYVHLQGAPSAIGFQHGYLLAAEIEDTYKVLRLEAEHSTRREWPFFRDASQKMLWPHIDAEYQQELQGIADGLAAKGIKLDVWDLVAMNAQIELTDYYVPWLNKQGHAALNTSGLPSLHAPGKCSAFIATGSYTKDGRIVIAHNNWSSYADGSRWTIIFDVVPTHGHRFLMDGLPGLITSQDDFGVNDAGLMITETTLTRAQGWNSDGKAEFVRSRKAMQYATSIDEYASIMRDGNNGGYANSWLIGDRKNGEIGYLELGLKNTPLLRKKDGYFVSSNFPSDPKLIKEDTDGFDIHNAGSSMNARHIEAEKKMAAARGQIDVAMAEQFLADHEDSFEKKNDPDERSLCGHTDHSPRGEPEWDNAPFSPEGAVQGKAIDSSMAAKMSFVAHAGHPCGENFMAAPFLKAHPEFAWQQPILKDMPSGPWTVFTSGQHP